jgi:hypothetical protein
MTDTNKERQMPPLVALAGALGSAAAIRWAYRTAKKINQELDEARMRKVADRQPTDEIKTLRRDPQTGSYRPGR